MAAHNRLQLEGKRFKRLTVLRSAGTAKSPKEESLWECRCDCGNVVILRGGRLTSGNTKSCGCYHKMRTRELFSKSPEEMRISKVLNNYRKGARNRGLQFALTRTQVARLIDGDCHYCGSSPSNSQTYHGKRLAKYQGIDRLDNSKGYVVGNVVPCCIVCNKMKKTMSHHEFLAHIQAIHERCIATREMCA